MRLGLLDLFTTLGIQPMQVSLPQRISELAFSPVSPIWQLTFSFLLSLWLDSHLAYFNMEWLFLWGLYKFAREIEGWSSASQYWRNQKKENKEKVGKKHQIYQWVLSLQNWEFAGMGLVKWSLEAPQYKAIVDMHQCVCFVETFSIEVFHMCL